MRVRLVLAGVCAASALLAGCANAIDGKPVAGDPQHVEPTFPTPRPPVTPPTTTSPTPAPPPSPNPPAGAEVLSPQNGYVFIETKSGKTRCQISSDGVGCEAPFTNPPTVDGTPANGVRVTVDGEIRWVVGNLGAMPVVTLDYRTYYAVGWTIEASSTGTRFTNERTGRGMTVSVESVQAF